MQLVEHRYIWHEKFMTGRQAATTKVQGVISRGCGDIVSRFVFRLSWFRTRTGGKSLQGHAPGGDAVAVVNTLVTNSCLAHSVPVSAGPLYRDRDIQVSENLLMNRMLEELDSIVWLCYLNLSKVVAAIMTNKKGDAWRGLHLPLSQI